MTGEELDHTVLTFGKYKGQTPSQIAEHDPQWLVWLAGQRSEKVASSALLKSCQEDIGGDPDDIPEE
jgi:hypothetical protein